LYVYLTLRVTSQDIHTGSAVSKLNDRNILAGMLGALVGASLLVTAIVIVNLNDIHTASDWRQHTYIVLDALNDVPPALSAEDGARARHLAQPSPQSLDSWRLAVGATDARVRRVSALTADNPLQQARLQKLAPVLAAWRRSDAAASTDPLLRAVREALRQFGQTERGLLALRAAATERTFAVSYWTLLIGVVAGCLFTGAIWWRAAKLLLGARDAAEKTNELSAQLLRVGRLNALGEMAGTLAHELNQPLTAATSYLAAARRISERDPGRTSPRVLEIQQKAAEQVTRAGEIIQRMRRFVQRGANDPQVESVSAMVEGACALMLAQARRDGVKVRLAPDGGNDRVMVDRIQIQQVLVNLIRNALEAMSGSTRRELVVGQEPSENNLAHIYVADTGPGLSPNVESRLFQPFVSSKADGMGVGLSVCRNIVEAHGGKLWAERNVAGGATFHLTLPKAKHEVMPRAA
jgi:C4-dicarboxylate-specific signal transduction histidine kinase